MVQRRPKALSAVSLVVIAVLAVPVLSLRLGSSDAGNNPASSTTRQAYDLLADGFGPGFNGPLQLVAETPSSADRGRWTGSSGRWPGPRASRPSRPCPRRRGRRSASSRSSRRPRRSPRRPPT
ncbi:hypothetical protein ACFQHO_40375 [Actinomadura yumaensis]|uniref:hypothetical protein n=1 Tax=Actinomadura yumaensis TaxID=111807 RepID=UPI003609FFF6